MREGDKDGRRDNLRECESKKRDKHIENVLERKKRN